MKKIMRAVGLILLMLVIYFVAQSFVGIVLAVIHGVQMSMASAASGGQFDIQGFTEELTSYIGAQSSWIILIAVAVSLPTFYLFYRDRRQDLMTFVSLRSISPVSIPVLIILGLSLNIILELLLVLASQLSFLSGIFESYNKLASSIFSGNIVITLIAVGIIGPIFEEILFRGLIFGELRKITKVRLAIFIQALLFGIYHMNVVQGTYAFLIGLLLGYIYYRSNSIFASMIIHITINTSSTLLPLLISDQQFESAGAAIYAASIILFFASGAFILISRSFRRNMDNSLYTLNHTPRLEPPREAPEQPHI
jgi:uncharacterized protein